MGASKRPNANNQNAVVAKITAMEESLQQLQDVVARQQETIQKQDAAIQEQRARFDTLELKTENQDLVQDRILETLSLNANDMENATGNSRNTVASVAFSAYATNGDFLYNEAQVLKFDGETYNTGEYSPGISVFQCPMSGLYYFNIHVHFRLRSTEGYAGQVGLYDGDGPFLLATVSANSSETAVELDVQSSSSVIVTCSVDDLIYVEADVISRVYGAFKLTTFSGMILM